MKKRLVIGSTPLISHTAAATGEFVSEDDRDWYRITHFDAMEPFLVSVTNTADIWMFVSTSGGLTAGRATKESAVFPYVTVDKIDDSFDVSGALTALLVNRDGVSQLWKPFGRNNEQVYEVTRSFYKSIHGDAVMFAERNESLGLEFRYGWEASPSYGIHRFGRLKNVGAHSLSIDLLDGIRNIVPAGVGWRMQTLYSNLLDAYKRSESDPTTGMGIFSLSATPTDLAEPSESLRATTVWSYGLSSTTLLLSENQVASFFAGESVVAERDVKGRRGAYLGVTPLQVEPGHNVEWGLCAEVEQDHVAVNNLRLRLERDRSGVVQDLAADIRRARENLTQLLATNDAIQRVGSKVSSYHHRANVLFNIMRGGYFADSYTIQTEDFIRFAEVWSKTSSRDIRTFFEQAPAEMRVRDLRATLIDDPVLRRLSYEYLPLTFSRRHGDPSRPWNEFSIKTQDAGGKPIIGYQGNWRDIFQNWEALCISYPDYFPSVIVKFLNATTIDGYNPYRITHTGIDWEVPEPENPWSNIGYWGDHQIVYLARLMEHAERSFPGALSGLLNEDFFVFANVPYRIKPFNDLVEDPRDTIVFDEEEYRRIHELLPTLGADARLVLDAEQTPIRATMIEKLLILLLAKAGNYVAGGGIWLNTQRPEWNDANNALAGWGLSIVTVAQLLPYVRLIDRLIQGAVNDQFTFHVEVATWLAKSTSAFGEFGLDALHNGEQRLSLLTRLGTAAAEYRESVYDGPFSGTTRVSANDVHAFMMLMSKHLSATLRSVRTEQAGYQSYQMLSIDGRAANVAPLYPMLEGQVAAISSGILSVAETISLLDALREGPLYRAEQHSYMLYPNRELPGFLAKNKIDAADAAKLDVLGREEDKWAGILGRDDNGDWHFNGYFRNVDDLKNAATDLSNTERRQLCALFEKTFDHASFTGRSGTFFAFEGLGSIYWHMVSKLLLAVQERLIDAVLDGASPNEVTELKKRYIAIRAGLGFNKEPAEYGAVPIDPYSHTPWAQGAKQPGMTGQVKEEVIARVAELGLVVRDQRLMFVPALILEDQWTDNTNDYTFSYCGTPFTVAQSNRDAVTIRRADGDERVITGREIPPELTSELMSRTGVVSAVRVELVL